MGETRASAGLAGGWLDAKYLAAAAVSACLTCEKKRVGGVRRKIEGGDEPEPAPVPAGKEEGEAAETVQQEKWTMEWIQSLSPEQVKRNQ
jgi:hypothetical protein